MKNLSLLQQLQAVSPKKEERKYSIYEVEDATGATKIAIPLEKVMEFDLELEASEWKTLDSLIEKYEGFVVTKKQHGSCDPSERTEAHCDNEAVDL